MRYAVYHSLCCNARYNYVTAYMPNTHWIHALLCFTLRHDVLLYEYINACFTLLSLSCFTVGVCDVVQPCSM